MALPPSLVNSQELQETFPIATDEDLLDAREYAAQEKIRRRKLKREQDRLAQQRCRARKKAKAQGLAAVDTEDVPDMDVPEPFEEAGSEDELVPETGDHDGDGAKQRSDRMEQNKQKQAMHILAHQLSVSSPPSDSLQPCCNSCKGQDATLYIHGHNLLYCAPCLVQAYPTLLPGMRVASYTEQQALHPVQLAPYCQAWSYFPLSALCSVCRAQQWVPQPRSKKLVLIDTDGIWQYASADYSCGGCGHRLQYTDPLTYTSATYLPGSPVITTVVVAVAAIKQYLANRQHVPQFSVSAFVKTRGAGPEVGCHIVHMLSPKPSHILLVGRGRCWFAENCIPACCRPL